MVRARLLAPFFRTSVSFGESLRAATIVLEVNPPIVEAGKKGTPFVAVEKPPGLISVKLDWRLLATHPKHPGEQARTTDDVSVTVDAVVTPVISHAVVGDPQEALHEVLSVPLFIRVPALVAVTVQATLQSLTILKLQEDEDEVSVDDKLCFSDAEAEGSVSSFGSTTLRPLARGFR